MKKLSKRSVVCIICLGICAVWRVIYALQVGLNAETKNLLSVVIAGIVAFIFWRLAYKYFTAKIEKTPKMMVRPGAEITVLLLTVMWAIMIVFPCLYGMLQSWFGL